MGFSAADDSTISEAFDSQTKNPDTMRSNASLYKRKHNLVALSSSTEIQAHLVRQDNPG